MAASFYITGFPRSRTAWCAAFLSTGAVRCEHDASLDHPHFAALNDHLVSQPCEYAGDSDSGLLAWAEELELSGAPVLFVHRPGKDVARSFERMGFPSKIEELRGHYFRACDTIKSRVFHIAYDNLNNEATMRNAWDFLLPGIPWDSARWRMFRDFNIQVDMKRWAKRAGIQLPERSAV